MSRRIVSVMLVFLMLMSLGITSFANDVSNEQVETTTYRDTDSVLLTICQSENGNMVFAGVYKDAPSVVYQWVGTVSEFQLLIPEGNPFDYLEELPFTELEGIEVFNLSGFQNNTQMTRDYNVYEANAVVLDMKRRFGFPREWYARHIDDTSYAPLVFTIREDVMVSAEEMGLRTLPKNVTIASAAVAIAPIVGATVPATITWICTALSLYSAVEGLDDTRHLQMYRGSSVTLRVSTVTAPGESETPLDTTSRTYIGYYAFDDDEDITSENASDAMAVLDTVECIYAPSEYAFDVENMVEDAYDIYMG